MAPMTRNRAGDGNVQQPMSALYYFPASLGRSLRKMMIIGGRLGERQGHSEVTGLVARVLGNERDAAITPRSHMLLCVGLNEKLCIADVGFGILTPTGPGAS